MRAAPTTSLFLQALGLVAATLVAVLLAATLVVLNMPPPAPDVYNVQEVAQALRTGKPAQTIEGGVLEVRTIDHPPTSGANGRRHLNFRIGLAQVLHRDLADVVVAQNRPRIVFFGPDDR